MKARSEDAPNVPALEYGYAAVPINMGNEERAVYREESLTRIRGGLVRALHNLDENGEWTRSGDKKRRLQDLVDKSLTTSHEHRLGFPLSLDEAVDTSDERFERAKVGEADPEDLLTLLMDYPVLYSIELAKLSHPFNATAPEPMNRDVLQTVEKLGGVRSEEKAYYRRKTLDAVVPALTLLRKHVVGTIEAPAGLIRIMNREAFLIRGDYMAQETDPDLDLRDMVLDKVRENDLGRKVEAYYPHLHNHPHLTWLQPIASSYYAKYVSFEKAKDR